MYGLFTHIWRRCMGFHVGKKSSIHMDPNPGYVYIYIYVYGHPHPLEPPALNF